LTAGSWQVDFEKANLGRMVGDKAGKVAKVGIGQPLI
jgi:hypothetical protein